MPDEIIRELTTKNNDEQVTSEGVLTGVKRIEAQRAQAAILNNITESCQFDKVKVTKKPKEDNVKLAPGMTGQCALADTVVESMCQGSVQLMARCAPDVARQAISRRCARVKQIELCMSWK